MAPVNDDGELLLDASTERLTERTRMIAVAWVSNVLGTVNPVHEIVALAHARGLPVLIDAAQAVQHIPVDVQELDCDFLVFSGHKLYGPSGVGVLYGKAELLEAMPPYQGGGDMIESVSASPAPTSTRSRSSSRPARPTSRRRRLWRRRSTMSRRSGSTPSPRTRPSCWPMRTRA